MTNDSTRRAVRRVTCAFVLAVAIALTGAAPGWASGSPVMPPSANPHGYSLVDMATEVALFTSSGNQLAYYPDTPFQILYTASQDAQVVDGGLVVTGANSFSVRPGKKLYVPVISVTDSPPVLGVYPTTPAQAKRYFFGPHQVGARDTEIVVDGTSTPLRADYLAGPLDTPPLLDGGGTHSVALGAFLHPLSPGTHTVTIRARLAGDLVAATYGLAFVQEEFTYTVQVVPGH